MKTLTLLLAGSTDPRLLTVTPEVADAALTGFRGQQVVSIPMAEDGSLLHVNMRQVAGIVVEDAEGEGEDADAPDPAAQVEALQAELDTERSKVEKLEREKATLTVQLEQAQTASTDEQATDQKMIPDPDPAADPDRTVDQLKEALDKAGVDYPSSARKADLQELAREHGV